MIIESNGTVTPGFRVRGVLSSRNVVAEQLSRSVWNVDLTRLVTYRQRLQRLQPVAWQPSAATT
eukprot:3153047-Rhodomonas_salina.1